ncbi:hypothetical protein FOZ62_007428 [Perkinsus olseni]|uniref:Uncharacterized protein n=2 Tax=Perkinsus olseni TaxID=32597 RepID=A0A7J6PZN2_PEROL|nr:hypothetical protein FOZ62_007428 [Perkinsus olseni]
MARCGHSNFLIEAVPWLQDQYWRECIGREQWQHYYHPLNTRVERPTYEGLNTTSVDFLAKPWLVLGKLQTSPAGKQCFYLTEPSASPFEPRPAHLRRTNSGLPCSSRRSRSIKGQRSSGSSSTTSKSSNNSARLLARSVSQPDIPSFQRIMNK